MQASAACKQKPRGHCGGVIQRWQQCQVFACVPAQAWTYKKFGFPVPYLVVGRWTLTPFPRRTPLRFVVGAPIDPPEVPLGSEVCQKPTEDHYTSANRCSEQCSSLYWSLLRCTLQPPRMCIMPRAAFAPVSVLQSRFCSMP